MRDRHDGTKPTALRCAVVAIKTRQRSGFTIIDLMVSIAVMAVLLGLTAPSLRLVTEAARRVKCQKKLSDIGLAMTMWSEDHRDLLPPSQIADDVYSAESADSNDDVIQSSMLMEVAHRGDGDPNSFDGLGRLLAEDYINNASAFYCPSHHGEHTAEIYETSWVMLGEEIVINFHYRLMASSQKLSRLDPATTLVTDGMRSVADYNHISGNNMLKADMSVAWFSDDEQYIASLLPTAEDAPGAGIPVNATWTVLDTGRPPLPNPSGPFNPNANTLFGP